MKTYVTPEEVSLMKNAATNERDRALIDLLFASGGRNTEILGVGVEDIDFENSTITIKHLKVRQKLFCPECGAGLSKSHTFCPKCGIRVTQTIAKQLEHRRQRTIPVSGQTLAEIKGFIDRGGPVERNGKKLLFPINRHRCWQIVKQCAERAGLPKLVNPETGQEHYVSPHKLRDAFRRPRCQDQR